MNTQDLERFIERWSGQHGEEQEARSFLLELLSVLGIGNPTEAIQFEKKVPVKNKVTFGQRKAKTTTKRIDAYIPFTKVLIEMKGTDVDLDHLPTGEYNTAYEQAKSYYDGLKLSEKGRWIVTSNFHEIRLYDMENPTEPPTVLYLDKLTESSIHALDILIDKRYTDQQMRRIHMEQQLSIKAGELVGELYKLLLERLHDPTKEQMKDLNILIVRLVFCFYAEDADLFQPHQFHDYLKQFRPRRMNRALSELFEVLDTPEAERDGDYLDNILLNFPYVNGGLFAQSIRIPIFTPEIVDYILEYCSEGFDWSGISPTIFGALFESTLNPEARRSGGMHYTSVENIHKVIDPLFLDELKEELNIIKDIRRESTRQHLVYAFQQKLGSLTFFDPACGSGNFLTESYLSLRRLENEALKCVSLNTRLGDDIYIMVHIQQFYGIEINDFAVAVATTALYIAEAQMYKETKKVIMYEDSFLPLRSYTNIHKGNALRIDWSDVISPSNLSYILGNPPFLGYSLQSKSQKEDIRSVYVDEYGKPYKSAGKIDYVAGWYFKACEMMKRNKQIESAFVSTNSICQGEQVPLVWKPLRERFHVQINFAYTSFVWHSEATTKANVHVTIIGFSLKGRDNKCLYRMIRGRGIMVKKVKDLNPYLIEGDWIFVEKSNKPLQPFVKHMVTGNRPADGGNLIIEADEYEDFIRREPEAKRFIKRLTGSEEFIKGKQRWCLWLVDISPADLRRMPLVMKRIQACKEDRLRGAADRQKLAMTPTLFREQRNPKSYLLVPMTSSQNRSYIPMSFFDSETIPTNSAGFIENATLYDFGVLSSSIHMTWMRTVAGRLKSDYRYSKDIVYDTFPWPEPTEREREKIERTAQRILDIRALYPDCSLADLYDPIAMPADLLKAHIRNDRAVQMAYGFRTVYVNEQAIVTELMQLYQALVSKETDPL